MTPESADIQPVEAGLSHDISKGEAVEASLEAFITRRHDARVSFARALGVEQSELTSRLDTLATRKRRRA